MPIVRLNPRPLSAGAAERGTAAARDAGDHMIEGEPE